MKKFKIAILGFLIFSFGFVDVLTKRVIISPKSSVTIYGKSNVNSFQCNYNSMYLDDEITVTAIKSSSSKLNLKNAKIAIKSKGFDCGNKMITKDFKSILKSDEFDNIYIELKELDINNRFLMTKLNVQIAGVDKDYVIPMAYSKKDNNVKGTLRLNIKDFNLQSPKKIFGLIEVNDNVDISFDLFLQY